ncbi:hypothetical protein [Neorhizobium sp. DAR64860/K0K1]|uniref:hypothetical protein n=1 Tax=Neorhizobium sp. DAR64860/K0K1 TaxID=3421955 RepID=UPI003D2688B1
MTADIRTAIQHELGAAGATAENPADLLEVGLVLVQQGFQQGDIADALYEMESNGIVHLISGNRVVLLQRAAK